ncbi:tetratricopeptide repeat protein, partial [Pedobacter sp.]|uniref:tetratricopeptide repeat protein n=1 Tax=Pedobacter sp. TaxID=1411316 RepID=UPI003D7FEB55
EELILDFNNINRIPESIGRLQFIKKISLSFNDLNRLPDQISNLKTLEELNLNAGKIEHVTSYQWLRGFYRSDDPKPFKRVTINQIENFPEDLSKWTAIKKIYLTDNSKINTKQLWNGLLTIPSKEYLLDVENCGITFLPDKGWERFLVKSLNISNNRIEDIPTNIQLAPYLSVINFNQNKLKVSPVNLNQYVGNKAEKALWFIELGILADTSLTRTDDMVLALVKKSRNHHNRKEFKQALADANTALSINDSLAMIKLSLTKMGELNYEMGNYQTAINYLSKAILKNKDDNVRIMNFVIPPFEYRAKSYLKLGDTLSAIKDYETLAENYSDRWGEVGLLYKATGKADQAKASFEKGIIKFQQQIEFNINKKQPVEMYQLSRLELMIIKEEFVRALKYANKLEKDIKLIDHITLLRYLKASAEIGSNAFNSKSKAELLNFIQLNKNLIGGWGYELFDDWLNLTTISQDKKKLIGEINNRIKP